MSDTHFQLRRGLASVWAAANPVLLEGERALETDTGNTKCGDGSTAWNSLPYEYINTYRLLADQAAKGPTIQDFFDAGGFTMKAGGAYEVIYDVMFTKTTSGTAIFTLSSAQAPVNLVASMTYSAAAGIASQGTGFMQGIVGSTATAAAFAVSSSLTTGANHRFLIKALVECHATLNSYFNLRLTCSAGTFTAKRGSSIAVRRLPNTNPGVFG